MRCTTGEPTGKPYHRANGGNMLKFKSNGLFYECTGKDAFIMDLLFGYKIHKEKVSFPVKIKIK